MLTSREKPERMATFVEPWIRAARTQAESGYTSVFNDTRTKAQDRSEIVLHVPSVNVTSVGIAHLVITHWFHHVAGDLLG